MSNRALLSLKFTQHRRFLGGISHKAYIDVFCSLAIGLLRVLEEGTAYEGQNLAGSFVKIPLSSLRQLPFFYVVIRNALFPEQGHVQRIRCFIESDLVVNKSIK